MASVINLEKIATSPYAPAGKGDIALYAFNDITGMTLPQLVMAVCIRQAALIEQSSVRKMNEINASASFLTAVSLVAETVTAKNQLTATVDFSKTDYQLKKAGNGTKRCSVRDFLVLEVGIEAAKLPANIKSSDDKAKVFGLLKNIMNKASLNNQEQTIGLQSLLSRRDSTYNMSASVIKRLGASMQIVAGNF